MLFKETPMFYKQSTNQYITENTSFTIDDVQYPPQWLNLSTPADKEALGLVEVVTVGEAKDPTYYWTGETLADGVLTLTATPKDLADVQKQAVASLNQTAYTLLLPSDWMVVKAYETNTPMATAWNTYRATIRGQVATAITVINSAVDVDAVALAVKVEWANNPDYVGAV